MITSIFRLFSFLHLGNEETIVIFATLSVLTALYAVWSTMVVRDPMAGRIRGLTDRRNTLRAAAKTRQNRAAKDLRSSGLSFMRQAVTKLKLMRGDRIEQISMRLARAGWRSRDAVIIYLFAKAILPFVFAGGALMFFFFFGFQAHTPAVRFFIVAVAFVGGFMGADLFVKNVADKRIKEMTRAMPDALDLLVICAEAGLSLDAAMTRVGHEIAGASPVLAEEFSLTAIELGFLPNRQAALNNLMNRTNMSKLRALVNSLLQTERYGTPLANALRVLAAEFRDERIMLAEEKASKLPAKMTVPMITFILPALFLVLGGPAIIQVMQVFSH
jgi:tight adherence protein C